MRQNQNQTTQQPKTEEKKEEDRAKDIILNEGDQEYVDFEDIKDDKKEDNK